MTHHHVDSYDFLSSVVHKMWIFEEYSGLAFNTMTVDENSFTLTCGSINDLSHPIALCEVKDEIEVAVQWKYWHLPLIWIKKLMKEIDWDRIVSESLIQFTNLVKLTESMIHSLKTEVKLQSVPHTKLSNDINIIEK